MSDNGNVLDLVINYPTEYFYPNELTPYPSNYNQHPESQIEELRESLETFGQFKPVVVWRCPKNETLPDGNELHEGLNYLICGHGLWQASLRTSIEKLEAKNITGVSRELAESILVTDNAAPLGSEPDVQRLAALLARAREPIADKPRLEAMLERLKLRAGMNGQAIDPMAEWQGMPEFEQRDKLGYKVIYVHFENQEAVDAFSELVGQNITDKTKYIWYPKAENQNLSTMVYKSES